MMIWMKVRKNRYKRNCFGKVALCLQKWINRKDLPSSRFCSGQVSNTTGALAVLGWGDRQSLAALEAIMIIYRCFYYDVHYLSIEARAKRREKPKTGKIWLNLVFILISIVTILIIDCHY